MKKSEMIARAWMPGTRQGSGRPAWAHPQDLVELVDELQAHVEKQCGQCGGYGTVDFSLGACIPPIDGDCTDCTPAKARWDRLRDISWLHDILEDGRKGDGSRVSKDDLYHEGIHEDVITGVLHLTHWEERETKIEYLTRLRDRALIGGLPEEVIIAKIKDRTCNLREGKGTFKQARWERVIRETKEFIVPMLQAISNPVERAWLETHLMDAINARPV